jgi:hypothetical protein
VARYVIHAPTLLHVVADDVPVGAGHRIVAPNLIRSQALSLLLEAVRRGDLAEDLALQHHERLTRKRCGCSAKDVVPLAPLDALTAEP